MVSQNEEFVGGVERDKNGGLVGSKDTVSLENQVDELKLDSLYPTWILATILHSYILSTQPTNPLFSVQYQSSILIFSQFNIPIPFSSSVSPTYQSFIIIFSQSVLCMFVSVYESFLCLQVSLLVLLFALFVKIDAFHTLVNRIISAQIDTPTPSSNPRTHRPDVGSDITATHPAAGEPQSNGVKREFSGSAHGEKGKDHSSDRLDMYWNKLVAELNETEMGVVTRSGPDGFAQMCKGQELCWRPMVSTHWPRLLNYAGYSTEGR